MPIFGLTHFLIQWMFLWFCSQVFTILRWEFSLQHWSTGDGSVKWGLQMVWPTRPGYFFETIYKADLVWHRSTWAVTLQRDCAIVCHEKHNQLFIIGDCTTCTIFFSYRKEWSLISNRTVVSIWLVKDILRAQTEESIDCYCSGSSRSRRFGGDQTIGAFPRFPVGFH